MSESEVMAARRGWLIRRQAQLQAAGAVVEDKVSEAGYGRFGHAIDPEGNRFELWELWEKPTD